MATTTTNFNLTKPADTDPVDIVTLEGDNMDKIDTALQDNKTPTFSDYNSSESGMPSESQALTNIKSKATLSTLFQNIKAYLKKACTVGQLVTNCMSSSNTLPLAASQGKVLQDQITTLNRKEVQLTNYYGDSGLAQTLTNEGIKFLEKDIVIPAKCKYIVWAHVTLETSNDDSIVFYMWEGAYIQNQNIRWDYSKRTQYTFETFTIGENITDEQVSLSLTLSDIADSAKTYSADNPSLNRIVAMIFPIA